MLRETQLEMAERHVREGEAIIARQRALIDRLAQDGHPTGEARKFLRKFQKAQEEHVAHLEQLRGSASSATSEQANHLLE